MCVFGQIPFISLFISDVSEMALTHYIKQLVTGTLKEMSSVFLNVKMLKSRLSIYLNVISLMLLSSEASAPLSCAVSKY